MLDKSTSQVLFYILSFSCLCHARAWHEVRPRVAESLVTRETGLLLHGVSLLEKQVCCCMV